MKKQLLLSVLCLQFILSYSGKLLAKESSFGLRTAENKEPRIIVQLSDANQRATEEYVLKVNGTNASSSFLVTAENLLPDEEITLTTPGGFLVTPTTISYDADEVEVTVTLKSTLALTTGQIILRSGDTRTYVSVMGYGTPLPVKDLSSAPIYTGTDNSFEVNMAEGFDPSETGYTMEFKVWTADLSAEFVPYAVTEEGVGFRTYVNRGALGMYNGINQDWRLQELYNEEKAHTFTYAVTQDNRLFIYRDGLPLDTVRAVDYALQPEWAVATGDPTENLLKNSTFEGEYNTGDWEPDPDMVTAIEGWRISPVDGWNSRQYIVSQQINNEQDFNNHVVSVSRYMWSDGYGAAEISQVVDVAPNEAYSLQALVRGGIKDDGTQFGAIKLYEVQNPALGVQTPVQSNDFETYALNYTTSSECKQLRVVFYLERDAWGASITSLDVDNVKLTGSARIYDQKIGFKNTFSQVDYFTYDLTGAYAPPAAVIKPIITAIDDDLNKILAFRALDGLLYFKNVPVDAEVAIYTLSGVKVLSVSQNAINEGVSLSHEGIYLGVIDNGIEKQTIRFIY
ncbi:MAG: hypothetical protein ABJ004_14445 [Cyclobacteriaceae bacterium]